MALTHYGPLFENHISMDREFALGVDGWEVTDGASS